MCVVDGLADTAIDPWTDDDGGRYSPLGGGLFGERCFSWTGTRRCRPPSACESGGDGALRPVALPIGRTRATPSGIPDGAS